jgi:hypothetical protein
LQGFAGHITDEHIQQLQSFTGDGGVIDYIGELHLLLQIDAVFDVARRT